MSILSIVNCYGISLPDAYVTLKPFAVFAIGIAIYSVFIFKFYRFLAKKDIFRLKYDKYVEEEGTIKVSFGGALLYIFKYIILFPLVAFSGFLFLSALLLLLAKDQEVSNIMLISMAVVSAIRMTSYYNEDLSRDLAKMLPLALLGVFLVDSTYFSLSVTSEKVMMVQESWKSIIYYLFSIIGLEFILRLGNGITSRLRRHEETNAVLDYLGQG
ncbi:MAG: hypothetical protein SVM80_07220 [Halobacteriota archaeon]|nr:hypothetical protein [Halobacteriota archaeon]